MAKTVVGLFDNFAEAQYVVQDLIDNGFRREDISVVAGEHATGYERMVGDERESAAAEGAGAGAVSGSVLGGALGLLVGAGLLAIPGIGPVLAAGPLAAAIGTTAATVGAGALGAGIGAAAGGLIGGLVGSGVPKEEAEYYAEGVRRGGTLVSVSTNDAMASTAYDIMGRHNVIDIDERVATWRGEGWSGYDASTEPIDRSSASYAGDRMIHSDDISAGTTETGRYDREAAMPMAEERMDINADRYSAGDVDAGALRGFDSYDNDYRSHYQQVYGSAGYSYEDYAPVYRYGHSLATDTRYSDRDWGAIEPDARRRWEEHNPGTWEQFKDTVRYAWDKARGKR